MFPKEHEGPDVIILKINYSRLRRSLYVVPSRPSFIPSYQSMIIVVCLTFLYPTINLTTIQLPELFHPLRRPRYRFS